MQTKNADIVLLLATFLFVMMPFGSRSTHAQTICKAPPQGMISWWDAEGDANDLLGLNHGCLESGAGFATGMVGQAFSFDGLNDFVKVPDAPSLNPSTAVTVEFWMRGDAANPMNTCCQGLVITDFYGVEGFDPYQGIGFILSKNDGVSFPTVTTEASNLAFGLIPGQWHHIAGTYDGSQMAQYVDGRLIAALGVSGNISPTRPGSFLTIGSEDGRKYNPPATANRYFHGLIDEASVYNRALLPEEISAIFAAGDKGKCKGVPFTNLSASLSVTMGPSANDDAFNFSATLDEGSGSDGVSPFTEPLGLRIGNFTLVIPGGSCIAKVPNGRWLSCQGVFNGISVDATLRFSGFNNFKISITGTGADLSGLVSPVNVELVIGNNGVTATLPKVEIAGSSE